MGPRMVISNVPPRKKGDYHRQINGYGFNGASPGAFFLRAHYFFPFIEAIFSERTNVLTADQTHYSTVLRIRVGRE